MCGDDSLALCERCAKNLQMLDVAQELEGMSARDMHIPGFPFTFRVSEEVPKDNLYFIPSRESLERALEHDEAPDLRRYFGVIKNIGS